jgi:autoinducer 2-degrading protein
MNERTDGAGTYAITVAFTLRPGTREAFLALVRANAASSVADEPGCHRFDVLLPSEDAGPDVFLYEIYADRAAFDRHLVAPHFLSFDAATRPMVERKDVVAYTAHENSK